MTLYVSEAEMIGRYTDSLKRAANRAQEYTVAELKDRPRIFVDFIDSVKVAAGSAHQLCHAQENPQWLVIRDLLEKVIDIGQVIPTIELEQGPLWLKIKSNLEMMSEKGAKLAVSKALTRVEVLENLNQRMKAIPDLNDSFKNV